MKPFIGNSRMKFKTRGFSYIEVLISIGILSFVMAFLVYLTILQSYKSSEMAVVSKAEAKARVATEFIRYRLVQSKFRGVDAGSNYVTLNLSEEVPTAYIGVYKDARDEGNPYQMEAEFYDPNLDSNSKFVFSRGIPGDSDGTLEYFKYETSFQPYRTLDGLEMVAFRSDLNGSIVETIVESQGEVYLGKGQRKRLTVQQDSQIFVRN